jgi:hypothetical protein
MDKNPSMRRLVVWLGVPVGMALGLAAPGWAAIIVVAGALFIVQVMRVRRAVRTRTER